MGNKSDMGIKACSLNPDSNLHSFNTSYKAGMNESDNVQMHTAFLNIHETDHFERRIGLIEQCSLHWM